jgi:hypothetical protein
MQVVRMEGAEFEGHGGSKLRTRSPDLMKDRGLEVSGFVEFAHLLVDESTHFTN